MSFWTTVRKMVAPSKSNLGLPGFDVHDKKSILIPYITDDPFGIYEGIGLKATGDTGGDHYASDTFAGIIRDQYNDWVDRYYPYLKKQMALTDNRLMTAQLDRANVNARQAQAGAQTGLTNQLARFGVSQQSQPGDNSDALHNALALAGAKAGIRDAESDRQLNILTGGTSPLRQQLNTNVGK